MILVNSCILLIACLFFIGNANAQLGYVNFTPMNGGDNCTGALNGTGYSWQLNTCIQFREIYYLIKYTDGSELQNSYVTFYIYKTNACNDNDPLSTSYDIGSCVELPTSWAYGWYYDTVDWAKVSVHMGPPGYIAPQAYRNTLYQVGDSACQTNYLVYFYYTNDLQFSNTLQTYTYWCQNNDPMQKVCTEGTGCITTSIAINCQTSSDEEDDFMDDIVGDPDYYFTITC
ncbi:hypothetical protein DLAC_00877 [Tieghemostelium lacteum]|uniref:Uncharacterized protein n=1 Tax=Tieghemostelium lacteum TaxID=361077 RepID=A0A152A7P6_TIELA|nr:hypothetical protein DLAC_00877 [Tieghemostelium lacteum]|eukprot:KYR02077.1 hypothetical protein DLAC_00877 [Tieghemostelium lacteum]